MTYPQTVARCHEMIARLEDKIEGLEAQIQYANADADQAEVEAFEYGLSRRESDLYALLRGTNIVPREVLLDAFGSKSHLNVVLTRARKKLLPFGIKIINQHSVGYRLEGILYA